MSVGTNSIYSIYEVADVYPMHYSRLTLDKSQSGAIRNEFMTLIENEWQTISKSTWIEIVAAPTGYIVALDNDIPSEPKFIRKSLLNWESFLDSGVISSCTLDILSEMRPVSVSSPVATTTPIP